jgi:hypothetical protein
MRTCNLGSGDFDCGQQREHWTYSWILRTLPPTPKKEVVKELANSLMRHRPLQHTSITAKQNSEKVISLEIVTIRRNRVYRGFK